MINTNLIMIMDILKNGNGALYQKHLIKIMNNDINERQIRRYLKKLKELEFLKVCKVDNNSNILYLTAKAYRDIFQMEKRISNTCNTYILEKNCIVAYIKYKHKNLCREDIFSTLYQKVDFCRINTDKILLKKYKDNIVMRNMYVYNHEEILEEDYISILQVVIYRHTIENKDLKSIIVALNELIERFIDIENNLIIDYQIYSFNNVNMKLLERNLDKYYRKKENMSDIANKYEIESFNLRDEYI